MGVTKVVTILYTNQNKKDFFYIMFKLLDLKIKKPLYSSKIQEGSYVKEPTGLLVLLSVHEDLW